MSGYHSKETHAANTSTRNNVLTISLSQHLTGEPISQVIEADWSTKAEVATRARLNNIGFDLNPSNLVATLGELRQTLQGGRWDGFLIGWCSRGYPERTELFEQIANMCVDAIRAQPQAKLMFCNGPTDLVKATLRSFP
ncbi:hypothetical protein LTR48_001432 [Friedmanniomyces endolithicus]|nr:hypothetical protein LTR48_001432 [Friedmanniomyces endolithicus]